MKKKENKIKVKLNLALKNHRERNFISAEKLYKEVLLLSPNYLSAIFNLATLYAQSKKFNLAKEMFLKANNIKPQDPNINLNLGNIFFETGDFEKAISFFENLTRINSNFALAHFLYSQLSNWLIASLGGAIFSAIWNFTLSSNFTWKSK